MINLKPLVLAMTLTLGSANLIAADTRHAARDVMDTINAAGFVAAYDLEYRYGVWTAEATAPSGERIDILFDPVNNTVVSLNKAALGTTALDAADVRAVLASQGYTSIDDIEFDDGLWKAKARNTLKQRIYLVIHPVTGAILSQDTQGVPSTSTPTTQPSLTAGEIVQLVQNAGYRNIHDLEFDDGVWEADAINAYGQKVDIKIDPRNGAILREKRDD